MESDDPTVAGVNSSGLVTPLKAGSTTIRVTTSDGAFTATCAVTVTQVIVSLFAGGGVGVDPSSYNWNGTGTQARFGETYGMVSDPSGNLFLVDEVDVWPSTDRLREISPAAVVTTPASGFANVDQQGAWPNFDGIDAQGNLYGIAWADNGTYIVKLTQSGTLSTVVGNTFNNNGTTDSFVSLWGLAMDTLGNIYVTDSGTGKGNLIRKITPGGGVGTFAGGGNGAVTGTLDGTGTAATFGNLTGIATDANGNVYVGDQGDELIRKITPAGVVTTIAGNGQSGGANGPAANASFSGLTAVTVDPSGNVFVADGNGIRKITPTGIVTTVVNNGSDTAGPSATASLGSISANGMAVVSQGTLMVNSSFNYEGSEIWQVQY